MNTTTTVKSIRPSDAKSLKPAAYLNESPIIVLGGQDQVQLRVTQNGGTLTLKPASQLPVRCTIRPMALYENKRGYCDVTTIMGRMVFAKGSTAEQTYRPFSHDGNRSLRALYFPIETMPDDDRAASPQRWANSLAVAQQLMQSAGLAWSGIPSAIVQQFLEFTDCSDPIEACALFALTQNAARVGTHLIEIGSYRGSSLIVIAKALEEVQRAQPIFSIDPHCDQPCNAELVRLALRQVGQEQRLIQIRSGSDEAALLMKPEAASLIFIDGDHSYDQAKKDIENYIPLLANGGYLLLHDYGFGPHTGGVDPHPGVRQAVDELLFGNPRFRPVLVAHTLIAFQQRNS